jgi:hypothetical protein
MSPYGSCETSRRDPGKCAYGVKAVMRRVMATLADGESWSSSRSRLRSGPAPILRQRERRNMGTSVGDEPAWIVPSASKPWRRYRDMFRGFVDSK